MRDFLEWIDRHRVIIVSVVNSVVLTSAIVFAAVKSGPGPAAYAQPADLEPATESGAEKPAAPAAKAADTKPLPAPRRIRSQRTRSAPIRR